MEMKFGWFHAILMINNNILLKVRLSMNILNSNFFFFVISKSEKCVSIDANIYNTSKYATCTSEFHRFSDLPTPRYPNAIQTSSDGSNDGSEDLQIYCRYRALVEDKSNDKNISLCLDIRGQQVSSDASIIGYQCAGSWNQYFR